MQVELGIRERGKRERLRRIKEAAFRTFSTQGYEESSTREIARLADVSIATLFTYAQDKRDLLLLVVNEDLDEICDRAIALIPREASVTEQLVALFSPVYTYFAAEPKLARTINREIHIDQRDPSLGAQAKRFCDRLTRWEYAATDILRQAWEHGRFKDGEDHDLLGSALLDVHFGALHVWLRNDELDLDAGIQYLTRMFRAVIGDRDRTSALSKRRKCRKRAVTRPA